MSGSNSPRVLHVAETIIGGVSTYLHETLSFQADALGHENVRVLLPANQAHDLHAIDPSMMLLFGRSGRNVRSLISFSLALAEALQKFRPSVVHLHSSFAGAVGRPVIAFQRPRPSVIYCSHGWSFLMDIPAWKQHLYLSIERVLARCTDVVINISRYEDQQAKVRGINARKCVVVRNAVSPAAPTGTTHLPFDPTRINLLFVGRFDRQKGLDLLVRAMGQVRDLPLHLYAIGGCFHDERPPEATPNVTLLGWLPRETLDDYYAGADALVMPSRWEGFGLVAIEAMRNRTPVVASNRGALPELIVDGRNGRLFDVDEADTSDLVRVLRELDKESLQRMGEEAYRNYQAFFTAEVMNRNLLELYSALHGSRMPHDLRLMLSRSNS